MLLVFGTGLVAVAAMPVVLSTIGFTIAGVSAVSTAAGRQVKRSVSMAQLLNYILL